MTDINYILFDNFETLDAFGPVEILGQLPQIYRQRYFSLHGGLVTSRHGIPVLTEAISEIDAGGILFIPGGMGTRKLVIDDAFLKKLLSLAEAASYVLTVCTGSALLAATGFLDGKRATSNKVAFPWASSISEKVNWVYKARWVRDENIYTSSGVSAGMDMVLGFISDLYGEEKAMEIAKYIEYIPNTDMNDDPFAAEN